MELKAFIRGARALVEAKEKKSITQTEMAVRLGVGYRTYLEYERGTNAPLAMKALLNLLILLDDQELVKVVREWEQDKELLNEQNK
jgi:transcriptional regulator with XRE-family HTH domain